ncbi:MAG: NADH-quinone oxidoreductase subunit NuoE [Candidatus Devosia phytovorans]|uniref:NADH-quinone oxidoreductase subunit NuoE n=1 Tax=Candidatus Devosia phytovorans TaxID=3121372 RepID=A0AAJ5VZB9_9HYPH|nr:NADH-quinone oxidoreductase subunit NuoE [Devosia sp.]WEK06167.1 MAG: NADH-quinone oxidoreductase subunit NuoE [Devosia sp.]
MVARRLADDQVQPASFAFNADNAKWADWKIGLYPTGRQQSAVIPLLMRAQEQDGWVSRATIEKIAEMLGMAYIRVLEVATFYTQFQLQPVGTRAHVQVCGTTPCMLRGAEGLIEVCKSKIHHDPHHLNEDGTLSWEEVECAGACVNAPMVTIFRDTYEDLTEERLAEIIDAFAAGKGDTVKVGTQTERLNAAPEGGRVVLLEEATTFREKFVPPPPPPEAAPAAAAPAAPATAAPAQAPTTAAKPKDVTEESAPAIKGPSKDAKVSEAKAEGERKAASASAKASGEPNEAMRKGATGAESDAAKVDGGKAAGKKTNTVAADGATEASPKKSRTIIAPKANPKEVNPVAEKGGDAPLFVAPEGAADDLKLIAGVGPVLERRLNALGITQWNQVAKLTPEQIDQVEGSLNFKGRVARDNWLAQSEVLARGGEEEYVRVFGKKPR